MNNKSILKLLLLVPCVLGIAGCDKGNDEPVTPPPAITEAAASNIKFNDASFSYDGKEHSITATNIPDDATVTYTNNGKVNPGAYTVTCKVTFKDGSVKRKTATLTISKNESVLTAEAVQTISNFGGAIPAYTLNNTLQEVKVKPIYRPGKYQVELFAPANDFYKESNHVVVDLTVVDSNPLNVKFKSKSVVADGKEHELVATDVPSGYTVQYKNNKATAAGKYNAVAEIYNAANELELTLNAILEIDSPVNQAFETYLDQFFVDYLGNDYISWNIFTVNPENFDLVRDATDKATWYTYTKIKDGEMQQSFEEMKGFEAQLLAFDPATLSKDQLVSYTAIKEFFDNQVYYFDPANGFNPLYTVTYISSEGGYAANFGTYAEAYEFRREQDVIDLLDYIKSMPEAFASYIEWGKDRIAADCPLSNHTLDQMRSYLTDTLEKKFEAVDEAHKDEQYYLIHVIQHKIDEATCLSAEQKVTYKEMTLQYFKDFFKPAHEALLDGLQELYNKCDVNHEGYYSAYGQIGRSMYEHELRSLLGIPDLNVEEWTKYLKIKIDQYSRELNSLLTSIRGNSSLNERFFEFYEGSVSVVGITDPNEMIDYLKEFAKTIVPDLKATPEITVKYMDEAAGKVSNAVAYYMKSPLDSDKSEHITLNPTKLGSNFNEMLSTMAHEGYPGHLYAYLYDKQLNISNVGKIMTSTAHAEGWATYVEYALNTYIKDHNPFTSRIDKQAINYYCDFKERESLVGFLAYTYADAMVHTQGWKPEDISKFFESIGFGSGAGNDVYNTVIESPTVYAAYGYGKSFYVDLHNNAKARLGDLYDEVEFNACILGNGWCSLSELSRITDEYIEDTLFEYEPYLKKAN